MVSDQAVGLVLAISSSIFIGASFIVKKRGLRIAANAGLRAGSGGFSYLREPVWWAGMMSMVVGEAANFAAYAFAPAILVTPLGALSIIVSAVLAHIVLQERLNMFGILGCLLCITGSVTIVLHAPPERHLGSVIEVFQLAMQPAFLGYAVFSVCVIIFLIFYVAPQHGSSSIFVYLAICSLAGSLSVMSCKALGIALKLTFQGDNQLLFGETYVCILVVVVCVMTQMNYLNKALDLFNTAIVSPVYYVMFTLLTILASIIMFRDVQSVRQVLTEACGFVTIVGGTFLLHATKDLDLSWSDLNRLTKEKEANLLGRALMGSNGADDRDRELDLRPLLHPSHGGADVEVAGMGIGGLDRGDRGGGGGSGGGLGLLGDGTAAHASARKGHSGLGMALGLGIGSSSSKR